jgi:hypothetical protein
LLKLKDHTFIPAAFSVLLFNRGENAPRVTKTPQLRCGARPRTRRFDAVCGLLNNLAVLVVRASGSRETARGEGLGKS